MTTPTGPPLAPPAALPPARPGPAAPQRGSLYARVVTVNAAVLLAAVLALTASPATVSSPVSTEEWGVLGAGLAVLVVADAALLRLSFSGLTALVGRMESLDLLRPRERLAEMGGVETRVLIAGFNTMLERLEAERRASVRRTVSGLEAERQRIGRELHDEIGQRLTGILLQLGRIHDETDPPLRARVAGVQEQARAALDEVGALAHQVRPGVLADLGLRSGLEALADTFRGAARVDTVLPERLPPLPGETELAVYRVAQEALTNAVRHADATRVRVRLHADPAELVLEVGDDGRGLTGEEDEGQGMRGMRERALLVGGVLRIDRCRPHGTRVRLVVPAQGPGG